VSDSLTQIAPTITVTDWKANADGALQRTAEYLTSVPNSHPWITWGGAALGALFVLQRVGPLIPYVGPFIGAAMDRFPVLQPLINAAWNAASHADEVAADKAKSVIHDNAGNLLAIAKAGNASPDVIAALTALAAD
jgi:hypothetical protein